MGHGQTRPYQTATHVRRDLLHTPCVGGVLNVLTQLRRFGAAGYSHKEIGEIVHAEYQIHVLAPGLDQAVNLAGDLLLSGLKLSQKYLKLEYLNQDGVFGMFWILVSWEELF